MTRYRAHQEQARQRTMHEALQPPFPFQPSSEQGAGPLRPAPEPRAGVEIGYSDPAVGVDSLYPTPQPQPINLDIEREEEMEDVDLGGPEQRQAVPIVAQPTLLTVGMQYERSATEIAIIDNEERGENVRGGHGGGAGGRLLGPCGQCVCDVVYYLDLCLDGIMDGCLDLCRQRVRGF